jgi:hypothetical protein
MELNQSYRRGTIEQVQNIELLPSRGLHLRREFLHILGIAEDSTALSISEFSDDADLFEMSERLFTVAAVSPVAFTSDEAVAMG